MKIFAASLLAFTMLATSPAIAGVKEGVDAWQAGNYGKAVGEWRAPAAAGDADAQFNLAQAYKLGRGVTMDMKLAEDWYRKAALQGHEQAQANLGLVLFQKGDRKGAMPWIKLAADRGEPRAQYVLGTAHFNGDLVGKDWVRAYALMTRAAASGLPQAATSLAQMDQYIPVGERQKGVAMAKTLVETAQASPPPAPAPAPAPAPKPAPVLKPVAVPPSAAPKPAAPPAPKPASKAAAASAGWKVQLGAFGSEAGAQTAWKALSGKSPAIAALSPSYVPAGKVYRLQAGPFPTRAVADKTCAAAKAAGSPCFPVAP